MPFIHIECVENCISRIKNNKAPGWDEIMGERISYSDIILHVHLRLLFNSLLRHSFVPTDFCN